MNPAPPFDAAAAHRYFSAHCFNEAWNHIDNSERSAEEAEQMVLLAQASLWHWTQRADCTRRNLSIGYWQLSRVYALLMRTPEALQAGERCLEYAKDEPPFFIAYGHEALARAARLAGEAELQALHLQAAQGLAAQIEDAEERAALEADLRELTST
jgi:hypothetical protein